MGRGRKVINESGSRDQIFAGVKVVSRRQHYWTEYFKEENGSSESSNLSWSVKPAFLKQLCIIFAVTSSYARVSTLVASVIETDVSTLFLSIA